MNCKTEGNVPDFFEFIFFLEVAQTIERDIKIDAKWDFFKHISIFYTLHKLSSVRVGRLVGGKLPSLAVHTCKNLTLEHSPGKAINFKSITFICTKRTVKK